MFETFRHIAERAQRYPVICRHNQMARPVSAAARAANAPEKQYRRRPLVIIEL
jgi:hypothetical protein